MSEWKALNKNLDEIEFIEYYKKTRNKSEIYCDNIMCFDTEVSSGFIYDGKTVEPYTGESQDYYRECTKVSLVYVWQFSIDDNIFMGRTLESFVDFLSELENVEPYVKIVYVHNLGYDFQFLRNVLNFSKVFAREKRKPIYAEYESYYFRCSYILTNQSLDSWAKNENLPVKKLVGQLDYNVIRTPKTKLTDEEIEYCIHDLLVMYYGLEKYKKKYGHICDIPLTQTGEVRLEVRKRMNCKEEYKYRKNCINLIPENIDDYNFLVRAFIGGYNHSNYVHTGRVITNVQCWDISSSYPTVMVLEKYPQTPFTKCSPRDKYFDNDKYSYIMEFTCTHLHSKHWNTFLSLSKCQEISKNYRVDNGRVISADYVKVTMTNIDYNIFRQCYEYEQLDILDFRVSVNDYLSDTFVKYILELYNDKTQLKGLEEYTEKYAISKQYINSMYGMMVCKAPFGDDVLFNNDWNVKNLTALSYLDKAQSERKKLSKIFTAFQHGVYVTAYARRNLWKAILKMDYDVVYNDTDSVKNIGDHRDFFDKYNAEIILQENKRADMLGLPHDIFAPKDKYGISHRLGVYAYEGTADKFKTLGAKKYICEKDGQLEMTVAGVRKGAVSQLNSIYDFNDGLVFDVEHAKKNLLYYNDNTPSCTWNAGGYDEYKADYRHGITMQPTTYSLAITPEYASLIALNAPMETKAFENNTKIV